MGELANCPNCGELFVKGIHSVCMNCYKEEERAFEKVFSYVRKKENRQATIAEVSDSTGVDENLIIKFVKERRIRTTNLPNLAYGCERCGEPIQGGKICDNCRQQLESDLKKINKQEADEQKKQEKANTYFSVNQKFRRKH
ncbi:TIGR03826 family flagellar region protein [Salinibacillus xinjiangensis]|uniref:Flagellar protein n=1 Tax=Salinibacillus xinjiangensis TaxID=1229268 RepID=A0A6G1X1G7_9BACI|nr:TIGR03826 family flagellar region protein [Salinibacillus xinjiangensis]MRG84789.1 hypothetical protein [Salinibacillus xinjiangensis]